MSSERKDYLEKLLSPYGEVEVGRTLTVSPRRDIDLWFAPRVSQLPRELGLWLLLTFGDEQIFSS